MRGLPNGRKGWWIAAIALLWTVVTGTASYYVGWKQKIQQESIRDFGIDEMLMLKPQLEPLPAKVESLDEKVRTLISSQELTNTKIQRLTNRLDDLIDAINRQRWGLTPREVPK